VLVALGALGVAACASGEAASPPSVAPTVAHVGALPGSLGIGGVIGDHQTSTLLPKPPPTAVSPAPPG